ncbi:CehA/McbA family metallohydrolase [Serratia aquatilis]|uniref:CehA/McbA family metallohydrolase n=1 Tax=Serratia aquatilis TaxID=1737515 RepID=A0ABV6EEV5_9GAMM
MLNFENEMCFGHRVISFTVPQEATHLGMMGTTIITGFIYAYLYDSRQQLRAALILQKNIKTIALSLTDVSFGAIAGDIPEGEWELHLYNLEGEHRKPKAMPFQVNISFDPLEIPLIPLMNTMRANLRADRQIVFDYDASLKSERAWYRGDLHAHTTLSDGRNTLAAAVRIAESQQLDFLFLTEHNLCHPELPQSAQTLFLPSLEVTADEGHFNVHGPCRTLDMHNADYSSQGLIEQGLSLADGNSFVCINHPMLNPWCWKYASLDLTQVHGIEIINDPTWSTAAQSIEIALQVFTGMWQAGLKIYGVGGSDAHLEPHERNPKATEPSIYGDPSTLVYADKLSGSAILAGLRQGRVYFERRCGLVFQYNQGAVLPGQDVGAVVIEVSLAVTDDSQQYYAQCVLDGDIFEQCVLSTSPVSFSIDMCTRHWMRIDIRRQDGTLEGMINPIFNGRQAEFTTPKLRTWGELMATLNID